MANQSANESVITPVTVLQASNVTEFNPNLESWNVWKERLDIHFEEIGCSDEGVKKSIMLKSIGAVPYRVLHSLCSPKSPVRKTYKELCEILDVQYTPPTIIFSERRRFHSSCKQESESEAAWYARVKTLALNCKFGANLDAFVLNQFIMGLPNFIFKRLCEEDESLTIQMALRKAMIMETKNINKQTSKNLTKNLTAMVAIVVVAAATAAAVEAVVAEANLIEAAAEAMVSEREVKRAEDQHVLTVDGETTALNLVNIKRANVIVAAKLDIWLPYVIIKREVLTT